MSTEELVAHLINSPTPRPPAIAQAAASRLFPRWQAALVGVPVALILASVLGCVAAIAVALPLGQLVGTPKPAWFGHVSEVAGLAGVVLGVWLVVRWMRGRRRAFETLAREGAIVPAYDIAATGLGAALGTDVGRALAHVALGAVGGTLTQVFGGPIAIAQLDGQLIEARTAADASGRFRVPELMLADRSGGYVALLHRSGWIAAQRVLRRRPATS